MTAGPSSLAAGRAASSAAAGPRLGLRRPRRRRAVEAGPVLGIDHEVHGVESYGRIDWAACEPCRALIDAGDYPGLLRRYGKRLPPMPVQAAWQAFWRDHGVAWPLERTEQP